MKKKSFYCTLLTPHLNGKADEQPLSRAVYVPLYSHKVKDKQEMQATHTYPLIEAKIFMDAKKMKQIGDKHYQMIISTELLPCVPFCLLSS